MLHASSSVKFFFKFRLYYTAIENIFNSIYFILSMENDYKLYDIYQFQDKSVHFNEEYNTS